MTKKIAVILLLSFLAASIVFGEPVQMTLSPPSTTIPPEFFGMHINHLFMGAREKTPWPTVPFRSWRLWGTYTYWSRLEQEKKGEWNFGLLDKYVDTAEQHRVEVLLTLGITPEWASSKPSEKSDYGPGRSAIPKSIADWQNYVRMVANRYKGRINEYEIWNEPNLRNYYAGSVPEMVQLAAVAYKTLKEVDPTITVCSPSATGPRGAQWLDEYLKDGGGKYADVIGFHFYVDPAPPERMVLLVQHVEQIMKRDGVGNKPLWDTETGWAIQNRQGTVRATEGRGFNSIVLSGDDAAAYVARAYILAWASGISRLYWYSWDNQTMGLVDSDGKTLKPPAIAYGQLENWLLGARMTSCRSNEAGTWTCTITRLGGYRAWIMWNPAATRHLVKFRIPRDWRVTRVRDLLGHATNLAPGAIFDVSIMPHLLEASER